MDGSIFVFCGMMFSVCFIIGLAVYSDTRSLWQSFQGFITIPLVFGSLTGLLFFWFYMFKLVF